MYVCFFFLSGLHGHRGAQCGVLNSKPHLRLTPELIPSWALNRLSPPGTPASLFLIPRITLSLLPNCITFFYVAVTVIMLLRILLFVEPSSQGKGTRKDLTPNASELLAPSWLMGLFIQLL